MFYKLLYRNVGLQLFNHEIPANTSYIPKGVLKKNMN